YSINDNSLYFKILMMKILHTIMGMFFLLSFLEGAKAQSAFNLTVAEFERGIRNDSIQVLDVRTPGEFYAGHIKNSLLADWKDTQEFNRRIAFIDKEKPVYVYCLGGSRSAAAAAKMRTAGYKNVFELAGGINAWKSENMAVEGKSNERQMSTGEFLKAINSAKVVLVDFGAEWCPPCKKMDPILKNLQKNYPKKFILVKVDGGKDEDILKKYQVTALPVFILFKDGKQVWRKEGVVEESVLANLVN
ncbi:MAG: thioredoxin domain-containing protein, partial [Ferruginibacter sp.]